jgi:hypothetical protein
MPLGGRAEAASGRSPCELAMNGEPPERSGPQATLRRLRLLLFLEHLAILRVARSSVRSGRRHSPDIAGSRRSRAGSPELWLWHRLRRRTGSDPVE